MKVISGKHKGRVLKGFNIDGTRPTMDRVKESLFAMIQEYIKDSVVLDLYSGTGNIAIEALSNGAKKAYLVDHNVIAIKTINDNLKSLNITNAEVFKGDAITTLKQLIKRKITFDIVFLDPPYQGNEIIKALSVFNENPNTLSFNALIVCETELSINYDEYNNFMIYKEKNYGGKKVTILKRTK